MSLNITVNGKFHRNSGYECSLLDDPARVKKQLECKLRRQRLQEVREQSKKIAAKIRKNVAAEKERQLRNLEALKAKEMGYWQRQKNQDNRTAIFMIGSAHKAAKIENEQCAARLKEQTERNKKFNKDLKARLCQNSKKIPTQCTPFQSVYVQCTPNEPVDDTKKRKRDSCGANCAKECQCNWESSSCETEHSEESDNEDDTSNTTPTCISESTTVTESGENFNSDSSSSEEEVLMPKKDTKSISPKKPTKSGSQKRTSKSSSPKRTTKSSSPKKSAKKGVTKKCVKQDSPKKSTKLSKNAPIVVDIEECGDNSSAEIQPEIGDKYAESNRQYSHVVRQKSPEKQKKKALNKVTEKYGKDLKKSAMSKPRFTQVSNLIKKKEAARRVSPIAPVPPPPPPPSLGSPVKGSGSSKSLQTESTSTKSGVILAGSGDTVTLGGNSTNFQSSAIGTADKDECSCSAGRVQFYDYNNKYTKEYPQPGVVQEAPPREQTAPSAMEQAYTERQQQSFRQEEQDRMRARSEERGRKALEREQVRRDCIDLTEKLEALTKQYPELLNPTDVNLHTNLYHQNREERREKKRNECIEKIMLKPAIITCPEVCRSLCEEAGKKVPMRGATIEGNLNLGAPPFNEQCNNTGSSESCCSILLGYVDDQTNQIRTDLNQLGPSENHDKATRLKNLLVRITDLRRALIQEIKKGSDSTLDDGHMQEVINGVSDVRKQRERIIIDSEPKDGRESPLQKHMHEVERKETVLEQKLRELCKMQKSTKTKTKFTTGEDGEKSCRVTASGNKPLEIVIRVKGEFGRRKAKGNKQGKSPRKVSTLIESQKHKLPKKKSPTNNQISQTQLNGQNSYDSNSTSYRSLPSRITNQVDAVVDQLEQQDNIDDNGNTNARREPAASGPRSGIQRGRINPLIAHYVQRLLGMSRSSVKALGVSSSEIETPASSIMNTPTNLSPLTEDLERSQQRLERVQQFIAENRSFINELEDSLRSQSNASLETSMRMFEDIWQERLRKQTKNRKKQSTTEQKQTQVPSSGINIAGKQQSDRVVGVQRGSRSEKVGAAGQPGRGSRTLTSDYDNQQGLKPQKSYFVPQIISQDERVGYRETATSIQRGNQSDQVGVTDQPRKSSRTMAYDYDNQQGLKSQKSYFVPHTVSQDEPVGYNEARTSIQTGSQIKQPGIATLPQRVSVTEPARYSNQYISANKEKKPQEPNYIAAQRGESQKKPPEPQMANRIGQFAEPTRYVAETPAIGIREISGRTLDTAEQQRNRGTAMHTVTVSEHNAEEQLTRYEKLTENCTQRISELTELIKKVRKEKQRLVEITLSSVSEGRNSTEYIDLPEDKRQPQPSDLSAEKNISSSSGSSGPNALTQPISTSSPIKNLHQQTPATSGDILSTADDVPLEKHKITGISRDSGISMSRPMTAQELEPPSQTSTSVSAPQITTQRKPRPPPTIQRYSPKLIEDEVAHELSTIVEVDTPGTSHLNATATARKQRLQPIPFPTFEEYARELNLDITQLDADTSARMQQEYEELINGLLLAHGDDVPNYEEFPSLTAYLQNLTANQEGAERCQSPETLDELLNCLRLANVSIKTFPSRREYMRNLAVNSPADEMIETASLENIIDTRTNIETDSEPMNIEEELRRRNLLKNSFQTKKEKQKIFSSTTNDGMQVRGYERAFTESGVEQLSTTSPETLSGDLEKELLSLGMNWPTTMRQRNKEAQARSSTSSQTSPELEQQRMRKVRSDAEQQQLAQHQQPQPQNKNIPVHVMEAEIIKKTTTTKKYREVSPLAFDAVAARVQENVNPTLGRQGQFEGGNETHTSGVGKVVDPATRIDTTPDEASHKNKSTHSQHKVKERSTDCNLFSENGRPMNLRDFLTKELLKHCSSSSSSSDDSLRSQFLQSIIDSMTPRTNMGSNQRERQKTSTPVASGQSNTPSSGHASTSSPTQLFSGESRISSVHFREHSITKYYHPQEKPRRSQQSPEPPTANKKPE